MPSASYSSDSAKDDLARDHRGLRSTLAGPIRKTSRKIAAALDDLVAAIAHVGSTAVPSLAGKPILDIDVLLRSAADLPVAITRLASRGYEYRGDLGLAGREAFRTPPHEVPHHLYVCPPNSPEFRRHIAFRDYLRTHPQDAAAYAALKRKLASQYRSDREAYNQAKAGFVQNILRRAGYPSAL